MPTGMMFHHFLDLFCCTLVAVSLQVCCSDSASLLQWKCNPICSGSAKQLQHLADFSLWAATHKVQIPDCRSVQGNSVLSEKPLFFFRRVYSHK